MKKMKPIKFRYYDDLIAKNAIFGSLFILGILLFHILYTQSKIDHGIIKLLSSKLPILCYPYTPKKSYSAQRDLAITCVLYREFNLALNLISIRHSGCKATIVVLCDISTIFSPNTKFIMNELNIIVVRSFIQYYNRFSTDMTRTYFVVNYLKLNRDKFDRVFFFDSYDVFFETDPFQYFTEKKVYLFQESHLTINQDPCDRLWMTNCYNASALKIVGDQLFVCSGTVGSGSIDEFIKLYTIIDAEHKWKICRVDQAPLNFLLYSGRFKAKNLSYHVFSQTGPVLTLNLATKFYAKINGYTFVYNALNRTPAILHQTKNDANFQKSLYKRCQNVFMKYSEKSSIIKNLETADLNDPIN